ncbi:arabinan endo-1,5-alpha-L-arabinosidase [Metabacillus niabensis]|uniref:Arabinan endo-1,5-alpha-L-arabinosidase n=2 Tax=Metabacillus niabensis TaxID=324854 RepID=A0ABT9YUS7_9BACI|nr:arabinan endo-1,5-alpha-L-arabinosidase [Metabacillus niabensis]MDQ0223750.1 arabinan endo-1,5-alpha-L-arabinosidase [Metabacillus niabensis]
MMITKKKTTLFISILILLIVMAFAGFYYINQTNQTPKKLGNSQYPTSPQELPFEKVNVDIIHDETKWSTNNTHDAEIIKVDGWYYTFSTDYMVAGTPLPGIQIRKSHDMIEWEFVGRVFDDLSTEAKAWTNGNTTTFWAPDVVEMNGQFYLYYSVSQFGTRNSYIGLATSSSIEGPWQDQGPVIKTKEGDEKTVNAIDPGIIIDRNENPWMVYGSYFGGIFITELDKTTGKQKKSGEEGTLIAKRKSNDFEIEAPAMMYNRDTDMFYLTVSYGYLEDTYNVRVARSKDIQGPYVDFNGKNMIDTSDESFDTGTKIINSYAFNDDSGWLGTGHNGLLQEGDKYYLTHNARAGEDLYWSHLHVREIIWTKDGWPVVSPERYAGKPKDSAQIKEENLIGNWERIEFPRFDDSMQTSTNLKLLKNGKINDANGEDYWELDENTLKLYWYAPNEAPDDYWIDEVTILPEWDYEKWKPTLVFTGLNNEGTAIWGKQFVEEEEE